jgi:hypothetical protein
MKVNWMKVNWMKVKVRMKVRMDESESKDEGEDG